MTAAPLRLGTRKSPMAMVQSRQVARLITERTGRAVELVGITTFGDVSRAQLTEIGGTGVFVSGLRACLLGGEVDFAVHSLKDLPAGPTAGITLAAVTARDDPRDALAARDGAKLADLPSAARIGTGSPRPGPGQCGYPPVPGHLGRGRCCRACLRGPGPRRPPRCGHAGL